MSTAVDARAAIEKALQAVQDEVAKSETLRSNITQNMRFRKGEKEILKVQEEIDSLDIESAAKSRKEFNTKFKIALEMETAKQTAVSWYMGVIRRGLTFPVAEGGRSMFYHEGSPGEDGEDTEERIFKYR
jgi:hypothetical protein